MLNSGKKIRALRDKKKNSCIVRKLISDRKKPHNLPPPFQAKWSVPKAANICTEQLRKYRCMLNFQLFYGKQF